MGCNNIPELFSKLDTNKPTNEPTTLHCRHLFQRPDIDVNMRDAGGNSALTYARSESVEERVRNLRVQRDAAKNGGKTAIVAMLQQRNAI